LGKNIIFSVKLTKWDTHICKNVLGLLATHTGRFTTVTHESMFEIVTIIPFSLQTIIRKPFTHHKIKKCIFSVYVYLRRLQVASIQKLYLH